VKDHELEIPKNPNPLTTVTLRGTADSQRLNMSPAVNNTDGTVTQEMRQAEDMETVVWKLKSDSVTARS